MRLSASIALSLLACNQLSSTSNAFNQKTNRKRSASAMARMLQKAEANASGGGGGRQGSGGNPKNGGGGGGAESGGGGSGSTKKQGGPNYNSSGPSNSRAKKFADNGVHSAHLDANTSGITLPSGVEYTYGTPIDATFELTNDLIPSDTLATLDISKMGEWTMGIFMRMADPQRGSLKPITSASPSITEESARRLKELVKRERKLRGLQEQQLATEIQQPVDDGDAAAAPDTPPDMDMDVEARDLPTFNHVGSATFTSTDVATLDPNKEGTGFDIYLLDESGAAIIGPATFYMLPTADMIEAQEKNKGKKPSNHPLAKFDHSSKKKKGFGNSGKKKVQGGPPDSKGMGYGSGTDGGMVIATTGTLADYILMTRVETYALGDTVIVDYDLSPEFIEEGARRMLQGNSGGGGNDKSNGGGGGNSDTTTVPPGWDETTTTTTTTTTAEVFDPSMPETPGTPDGWDGELEGAAVPDPEPTIDGTDMSLFTMGVYMRMAHPQRGSLDPILSIPFCQDTETCGGKTTEELGGGEFSFSTDDLNVKGNGGGFDVWILNGLGVGVAGPYTFYVTE